jgi:Domain of unknown function (DUF3387)
VRPIRATACYPSATQAQLDVPRVDSQAFALAVPHAEALRIRDDVAFFQAVQAVLAKRAPGDVRLEEELEHPVRQVISRAVALEGRLTFRASVVFAVVALLGLLNPPAGYSQPDLVPTPANSDLAT